MILKNTKGNTPIFVAIISSIFVIALIINSLNFRIILEDIREGIHSYEPGVSRFISWDDSLSPGSKLQKALTIIPKAFLHKLMTTDKSHVQEIYINMSFENHQILLQDRSHAIEFGILHNPQDVNAVINFQGNSYKATIRLKGDLPDHWLSQNRMSLRVNLKNDKTILGLNKFSIQKPRSRTFPYDSVFQKIVKKIGLLAAQHQYARVKFNGKSWGIMDLESHISKEFIESEKRKDSIIVRFSNEDGWRYLKSSSNPNLNYRVSNPVLFSKLYSAETKLRDKINRDRYSYIINQRLKGSPNLYDPDSYLKMLILSEFWGSDHILYENNIKHYLNPYTLKLEAISSDQVEPRENDFSSCSENFAFTSSKTFRDINKADLSQYNFEKNINLIEKTIHSNINNLIKVEQSFFPFDEVAPISLIKKKNEVLDPTSIQPYLDRVICDDENTYSNVDDSSNYIDHVHARHYSDGTVEIFNLLNDDVEVLYVKDSFENTHSLNKLIPGYLPNSFQPLKINTKFIGNYDSSLFIVTRYKGQIRQTPLYVTITNHDIFNPLLVETPNNLEFLINDSNNWTIKKGNWNINYPIVVNGNLKIEEGTSLNFGKDAYLIVQGYLFSIGTEKDKINLSSQYDSWKGLYVLNSPIESKLINTSITNVKSVSDGILNLTGGVTFYNADVFMENVSLSNGYDEDLLNIVNSKFNFNNLLVSGSISDAIDFDFSEGKINNIELFDINGDALDFSGGKSSIVNANIYEVKDKAISAGEEAYIEIKDSIINDIGVGIASKDGSSVFATKVSIRGSQLAPAMAYIKKDFYGQPSLNFESSDISKDRIIAQNGSKIFFDGVKLKTQKIDVDELYESSVMKK